MAFARKCLLLPLGTSKLSATVSLPDTSTVLSMVCMSGADIMILIRATPPGTLAADLDAFLSPLMATVTADVFPEELSPPPPLQSNINAARRVIKINAIGFLILVFFMVISLWKSYPDIDR
jgi:hypothetical protein